jgi:hypothetical protein
VYRPARGELEIGPIVSPLRFDVTLRAEFFRFYAVHRELYRSDFAAFTERAREEPYFVWFERVMCPSWQPHVLADAALFEAAWAERLHASARLYDSFERTGFDPRFPIVVYEGLRVLPTRTGKRLTRRTYAGDGNHRLALLIAAGQSTLLPSQYRIRRFWKLEPSDTTPLLLAALRVDEQRYLAFLRAGYPTLRVERVGGQYEVTGSPDPATEAEIRAVLSIDTRHLRDED